MHINIYTSTNEGLLRSLGPFKNYITPDEFEMSYSISPTDMAINTIDYKNIIEIKPIEYKSMPLINIIRSIKTKR